MTPNDFRRIFATIAPDAKWGMVKLTRPAARVHGCTARHLRASEGCVGPERLHHGAARIRRLRGGRRGNDPGLAGDGESGDSSREKQEEVAGP
jgi:hypothetical protein